MDYKRLFLFSALIYVGLNLYQAWVKEYPTEQQVVQQYQQNSQQPTTADGSYLPNIQSSSVESQKVSATPISNHSQQKLIDVKTDVLDLKIEASNGDIIGANLLKYSQSSKEKDKPFELLTDDLRKYVANSSLFVKTEHGVKNLDIAYSINKTAYQLTPGQNELQVILQGQTETGLKVEKIFTLKRGSYLVELEYRVDNQTGQSWTGQMNTQLLQKSPKEDKSSMFHVGSYTGAAMSDPTDKLYKKVSFADISTSQLDKTVKNGWVAMQEHYFLSAWVPTQGTTNHFYSRFIDEQYIIGMVSQPLTIAEGQTKAIASKLYVGPEVTSVLEKIAPGLNLTVDYGMLSIISIFIFTVMSYIYKVVGNWGWSIVLVTMLIKLAFFKLSAKSYKSMAGMRKLQPQITALRERYANDKARLSQETMELYRKEQVNPLGGCLPILVQIPVFIALYWVLLESVELRQAPWILWIHDLSEPDPFYILPVIMGISMFVQQKLGPASPDPMQAKMMMMLPVLFTFLFSSFPAGLVLYWTVNNTLSILQQWYITRKYSDDKPTNNKGAGFSNKKLAMSK